MKYVFACALLLSACATSSSQEVMGPPTRPPDQGKEKKSWMCHAISAQNEARAHGEGHSGTCDGFTDSCAQEKALEACSRYHKDCEIAFCTD